MNQSQQQSGHRRISGEQVAPLLKALGMEPDTVRRVSSFIDSENFSRAKTKLHSAKASVTPRVRTAATNYKGRSLTGLAMIAAGVGLLMNAPKMKRTTRDVQWTPDPTTFNTNTPEVAL